MLATAGALPRDDEAWAFEPKWDGIRAIVRLDGAGHLIASSRNGLDLSRTFPELAVLTETLGRPVVLDGELVGLDSQGIPRFGLLQPRLNLTNAAVIERRATEYPASYVIFDVMHLNGESLLDRPYDERRELLVSLAIDSDGISTSPAYRDVAGSDVFAAASSRGLEGVVAKRRASRYQPGVRSQDWIKVKAVRMQEVVIGGWLSGQGRLSNTFGALLLGIPEADGLKYAGKVGTGFDERSRDALLSVLAKLAREESPFVTPIEPKDRTLAHWVHPEIVGEVAFTEWTRDGRLRHPTWRGIRPDKAPDDVVRESSDGGESR
jgi:bifunctional non-homologous end joining protein LigD